MMPKVEAAKLAYMNAQTVQKYMLPLTATDPLGVDNASSISHTPVTKRLGR